jgi:hypothetical protein
LSVSLAAACGDDDGDDNDTGGTGGGGAGGSAGAAGRGGAGGTAGVGGSGGSTGGTAGVAGDTGSAGDGGGTSGAAGTGGTAGTGGDDEPDAGPDAASLVDAGGSCPASLADLPSAATESATSDNVAQEVMITLIAFEGNDIRVRFRAAPDGPGFNFAEPLVLCTGSQQENCDGGVAELEGSGTVDGGTGILLPGEELEYVFENALDDGTETTAEAGELALVNNLVPSELLFPENAFVRAYVNWGGYVSLDPVGDFDGGTIFDNLETRAIEGGVWEDEDQSVEVGADNIIFATGNVRFADGFETCTAN